MRTFKINTLYIFLETNYTYTMLYKIKATKGSSERKEEFSFFNETQ